MKNIPLAYLIVVIFGACSTAKAPCIDKEKINPQGICTQQYEPVCGCNNITYGNECEAKNAGVTSWEAGECLKGEEESL